MTRNSKQCYEAPLTWAFEVEQECVICASPNGDTESFGNSGLKFKNLAGIAYLCLDEVPGSHSIGPNPCVLHPGDTVRTAFET